MTQNSRLSATEVSELFVLQKADFFADVHLWPERQLLDPEGWLSNFTATERPLAVHVLNVFQYYNENLCDALLRSAVHSLSERVTSRATSMADAKAIWRGFLDSVTVTYIQGEQPQPTDSGHLFARKARQVLDIPENHILDPSQAVAWLTETVGGTLLLLDDFLGSGRQICTMWERRHPANAVTSTDTLGSLAEKGVRIIYAPLVATASGLSKCRGSCNGLEVLPAHELDERYSLTHSNSILWPPAIREEGFRFLRSASERAGIIRGSETGWQGVGNLALPLAFWHSVPDATLPLLYWAECGWIPLVRRT